MDLQLISEMIVAEIVDYYWLIYMNWNVIAIP